MCSSQHTQPGFFHQQPKASLLLPDLRYLKYPPHFERFSGGIGEFRKAANAKENPTAALPAFKNLQYVYYMKTRIFLFLIFLFFCFFSRAQNWDIELLRDINRHRDRSLDSFFIILTDYAAVLAYSIPLLLFAYAKKTRNTLLENKARFIIFSILAVLVLALLLKYTVNRPRPFDTYPFIEKVSTGSSPSFPSGHTSDAFTLATCLSLAFRKWWVILPSLFWASLVAYSRMELGVHYPSDVLASILIGIGGTLVIWRLYGKRIVQKAKSNM